MDLIAMPVSKRGNDLIFTWVYRRSKTIVARAFEEIESSAVSLAKLTFETICRRIGVPQRMTVLQMHPKSQDGVSETYILT